MTTWMKPPRVRGLNAAAMTQLARAQHASDRLRSALVLVRSAANVLDYEAMPSIRRRMIGVLDELEAIEAFVGSIARVN